MSIFVSCDKLFQRVVSKCLIVLQKDLEKSNEQMQKINFAMSTILSEAIKILLLVIFFGYIHKLNLFMVCLFALLMLRSFVGGSHRETILGCFFQSLVTFATIIYLSEKIRLFYLKNIVVIIAMLGICFFSPCISRKRANMYSEARKQKFKVNALCSIIVLYTISEMKGETYGNIILWVFLLQTIELIVVAIVKNIGRRLAVKKNFRKSIVAMLLLVTLSFSNTVVSSAKVTTKKDSYSAYSVAGNRVCYVELTAEGNTSKHTISNYYKSAESTFPLNSVENQTKWKSDYGNYKKANFSANHKYGVPTPWGTIGYTYTTIYLSVMF